MQNYQSLPIRGPSESRYSIRPFRSLEHSRRTSTLTATPERVPPTEVPIAHSQDAVQETEGSPQSRQAGSQHEELSALRDSLKANAEEVIIHYKRITEAKIALIKEKKALDERETKLKWEKDFLTQREKAVTFREQNLTAEWNKLNDQPRLLQARERRIYETELYLYYVSIDQVETETAIAEREQEIAEREQGLYEREQGLYERAEQIRERENNMSERENDVSERGEKISERQGEVPNSEVCRQSRAYLPVGRMPTGSLSVELGDFWYK